jgi:hypothetical protein
MKMLFVSDCLESTRSHLDSGKNHHAGIVFTRRLAGLRIRQIDP